MTEAVEYMSHRNEEVEGVLNRRTSRGATYQHGSSEEHRVLKIAFLEEQVI